MLGWSSCFTICFLFRFIRPCPGSSFLTKSGLNEVVLFYAVWTGAYCCWRFTTSRSCSGYREWEASKTLHGKGDASPWWNCRKCMPMPCILSALSLDWKSTCISSWKVSNFRLVFRWSKSVYCSRMQKKRAGFWMDIQEAFLRQLLWKILAFILNFSFFSM